MSWKGFQKAIARLPQIVKQKTGMSEGTVDEDFKELNLTYVRIKQDTTKFLNECISYKAAMLNLLNFQVSLMEENQWNLGADNKSLDQYIHSLQELRTDLSAQLEDSVDRLLIKPLTEYQLLLQKVESIIKKRNNKLLDYDRNRVAHEKMTNNPARRNEMSEEKKILKQEQALNQATMEYDRYNNLLKVELPRLLDLRSQLQKPGVQTLLAFQKLFYSKSAAIFSSATFLPEKLLGDSESRFRKDVEPLMNEIRTMGMFHGSGLTYSPALSSSTSTSTSTNDLPNPPEYSELSASSKPTNGKGSQLTSRPPPSSLEPNRSTRPAAPVPSRATQKNFVRAIYDFNSEDSDDLSFKMGDLIEVLDSSDQYGWWIGKSKQGKTGNFPSNYVMENK